MDDLWPWLVLIAVFAAPLIVSRLLFGRSRTSSMSDPTTALFDSSRSSDGDIERGRGAGGSGASNA
jgi:hypothetical protein